MRLSRPCYNKFSLLWVWGKHDFDSINVFGVDDLESVTTLPAADSMKTFLFICTGNICRSPMAEALFRHATNGRTDYRAISAGLGAIDGQPPSVYSVQAMKEIGVDIARQRSHMLTAQMVKEADYILGMTHSHVDTVTLLYPQAVEKTFLLREFDDTLDTFEKDISDPIGGSYEVYLNCRDQIEQGIASLVRFIEQGETNIMVRAVAAGQTARVAIGSDHGGFELKEALKKYLRERGVSFLDFGTHGEESVDYPDYALLVANSVAEHKAEVGLLVSSLSSAKMRRLSFLYLWSETMQ